MRVPVSTADGSWVRNLPEGQRGLLQPDHGEGQEEEAEQEEALQAGRVRAVPRLTARLGVADGLDVVAVRIEHEGAVVTRVIDGPRSGLAVVAPAGGERGRVKGVDGGVIGGGEGDMGRRGRLTSLADPEVGLLLRG
jgi:hypothetical protein